MHFGTKSYLKSTRNHIAKHALRLRLGTRLRSQKIWFFFVLKFNIICMFWIVLMLMSKMIFKKWKNIIGMHFGTKNYLKSTRNHTAKHTLKLSPSISKAREPWGLKMWGKKDKRKLENIVISIIVLKPVCLDKLIQNPTNLKLELNQVF